MSNAYRPESWHELYILLGGAAAALTGLLFVATSLHVERIIATPHWRRRLLANTFSLTGVLIESILVTVPQPAQWLGYELVIGNLFLLAFLMAPLIRSWIAVSGVPPLRLVAGTLSWLVGAAGGAGLIFGAGGGMFLVTASCVILIWVCVWNAWSLLIANYRG